MGNFFGNLINRHREQGSESYSMPMVEPRPKARYEVEPDLPTEQSTHQPSAPVLDTNAESDLSHLPISAHPLPKLNSDFLSRSMHENESSETEAVRNDRINNVDVHEQVDSSVELPRKADLLNKFTTPNHPIQHDHESSAKDEVRSAGKIGSEQHLLVADDLDQRIRSVLYRLKSSEYRQPNLGEAQSTYGNPLASTGSNYVDSTQSEQQESSLKKEIDEPIPKSDGHKNIEREAVEPVLKPGGRENMERESVEPKVAEMSQEGLLNIPNWLTNMQSDFNRRWQDINAELASEKPVVNVTIGRVEVRAVQNTESKVPKVKKKPSGVMSLDDYLRSRDKEERA